MDMERFQLKDTNHRNRQMELALRLIHTLGFEEALMLCRQNHWYGVLKQVEKVKKARID